MEDLKFDLNDIVLIPSEGSDVNTRSECNINNEFNFFPYLPLMAAPMDTVVCEKNYMKYLDNGIIPCLPRGFESAHLTQSPHYFQSFGLADVENSLSQYKEDPRSKLYDPHAFYNYPNVLIDIANGHMSKLVGLVKDVKERWPQMILMVGNVANPETFANLGMAGADFVRCSIGTGAGCTTAANVAINYPIGSLISECREQKVKLGLKTGIVADGGMKNYSDIIKALALGADFVMIGSLFNKAMESSGFNYWKTKFGMIRIKNYSLAERMWRNDYSIYKKYRGMSTKAVQRKWGKTKLVTAEGITKYQKVEYSLSHWKENFNDYLKSAMSYCNAKKLGDFVGYAQYVFITESARRRFDK